MAKPESLHVIALISGGKDSFFSLLHCLRQGHKVVALGNLYPAPTEERDLNSFMYQTVGHTIIPLYAQALGIPLYRQEIVGTAVQTAASYNGHPQNTQDGTNANETGREDETESLVPLLKKIREKHPDANAVCTGAILSTYQRTRIEAVCIRLGLVPLAFLWQFPALPPKKEIQLLEDMEAVGLDARIVKVASGGLDEGVLWENVASLRGRSRVSKSLGRLGGVGKGAVIGEGGEFETVVLDGPKRLFRGSIVVDQKEQKVVDEGGGVAWVRIGKAACVMNERGDVETAEDSMQAKEDELAKVRVPELLEPRFESCFQEILSKWSKLAESREVDEAAEILLGSKLTDASFGISLFESVITKQPINNRHYWTFASLPTVVGGATQEMEDIREQIQSALSEHRLDSTNIISAVIVLRSMADFGNINSIYAQLFKHPNPPSRITISAGHVLPADPQSPASHQSIIVHLTLNPSLSNPETKKALHVQSRSYWAPANIGPYSQAISSPISSDSLSLAYTGYDSKDDQNKSTAWIVSIAGQIPLVPATMALPPAPQNVLEMFILQTTIALQHLWRVAEATDVQWFTSSFTFLARKSSEYSKFPIELSKAAKVAAEIWRYQHAVGHPSVSKDGDEEEKERDLWEEKFRYGSYRGHGGGESGEKSLPDWEIVTASDTDDDGSDIPSPPLFAAEIEEVPRGGLVEWGVGGGVSGARTVKTSTRMLENIGKMHTCVIDGAVTYTTILLDYTPDDCTSTRRASVSMEQLREVAEATTCGLDQRTQKEARQAVCNVFVDAGLPSVLEIIGSMGMVVPCHSLWDDRGRRLGAVVLIQGVAGN